MDMSKEVRTWQSMASMPQEKSHFLFMENGDGFAYAFGGEDTLLGFIGASNRVERYDPKTDKWSHIGTIGNVENSHRSSACGVVVDGVFWIIGGKQ